MKFPTHRFGEYGILFTLCVFAAVGIAQYAGLFEFTDQAFGDLCCRFNQTQPQESPILLVYADPDLLESEDELLRLLDLINDSEPQKIGILAENPLPAQAAISKLELASKVIVGRPASQINTQQQAPIQEGFIDLALSGQAVYRRHQCTIITPQGDLNSFEKQIVLDRTFGSANFPVGEFGINFQGNTNAIPHVSAEDIFEQNIVSELILGNVVLIGKRMDPAYGFATPTTSGPNRMTRLELHGQILNTLLQRNFRQPLSLGCLFLFLFAFTVTACQIARQTSNLWLVQISVTCGIVAILLGWVGHTLISINAPVSGMMLGTVLAFGLATLFRFRVLHSAAEFWRLMMDLNRKELDPTPQKAWDLITDAVFQMFFPTRMVLMEMKPGETHLRVVSTINCDAEDIYENRRDVQRAPYRESLESAHPTQVNNRCFFHQDQREDEVEFMVPLIFSSQVMGFMAIAMDPKSLERWKNFENFLDQFANDVSIMLAQQRASDARIRKQNTPLRTLKSLPEEKVLARIKSEKLEQQNKIQRLNKAFERSESAMSICDMFGRVLRANSRLIRLLKDVEVVAADVNCVEMISKLTTRPLADCRRAFQQAIMNNRSSQLCIPPTTDRPYPSIMFVKPLNCKSQEPQGDTNYRRVVIEVIEGRSFEMINNWQNQLTHDVCQQASDQLEKLQSQLEFLKGQSTDPTHMLLMTSFEDSIAQVRSTFSRCQNTTQNRLTETADNCFPIPTSEIYQSTLKQYEQALRARGIEIVEDIDDGDCTGIANPFLLEKIFLTILDLLSENAFDESQLFISAQTIGSKINFQFRNRGGGTPLQGLRKSLVNEEDSKAKEIQGGEQPCYLDQSQLDRLSEIREWLEAWDGNLRIANLADYSLNIELTLMNESAEFPAKTLKVQDKSQSFRS
jgi:CHASE2 domain-containing sensor protein